MRTRRHSLQSVIAAAAAAALVTLAAPAAGALRVGAAVGDTAATPKLSAGFLRDLGHLAATTDYRAMVQFTGGTDASQTALLARRGIEVLGHYRSFDAAYVRGPIGALGALAADPGVAYVEDDYTVTLANDTTQWASRTEALHEPVLGGPYLTEPGGAPVDGTGVGVAVIDSGVDGSHPDLDLASNQAVQLAIAGNVIELGPDANSDFHSGHGTHVAGIIAGTGAASQGLQAGIAPGAGVHAFSAGAAISAAFVVFALDEINASYDSYIPAIRVINISAGNPGGTPSDEAGLAEIAMDTLINDRGVTVVVAAGNDGGGSADTTTGWCKNPTPGLICAANYDDGSTGYRDGPINDSSSRGKNGVPATYPDLAAPGTFVTSTCATTSGALCSAAGFITPSTGWAPYYADATGTSMSAPHVAGIVALVRQVNPLLDPKQVEALLKATAHVRPSGLQAFAEGAGRVDGLAAVQAAGGYALNGTPPTVVVSDATGDAHAGAADITSLAVTTTATHVTYALTVADLADESLLVAFYRIFQNVDGVPHQIDFDASTPDVTVVGNTLSYTVPASTLGASGAPVHNIRVGAYLGPIDDVAPSPAPSTGPSTGLDIFLRPLDGAAFQLP